VVLTQESNQLFCIARCIRFISEDFSFFSLNLRGLNWGLIQRNNQRGANAETILAMINNEISAGVLQVASTIHLIVGKGQVFCRKESCARVLAFA